LAGGARSAQGVGSRLADSGLLVPPTRWPPNPLPRAEMARPPSRAPRIGHPSSRHHAAAHPVADNRPQPNHTMDTRTSPFRLRIEQAQEALKRRGLAAVLVPSSDPHLSEYLPERWQGRQWLSGFTGSMGTLVVTQDTAAVFADS